MYLYATGTVRNEIDQYNHGQLTKVNWDTGETIFYIKKVFPTAFCARNENPRGGTRGWRGLIHDPWSNGLIIANNDSLVFFTKDLKFKRIVSHPAFGNIHSLSIIKNKLCITSTINDTYCLFDRDHIEVIEPLANPKIEKLVKEWLIIRDRKRKPFDLNRDYREEWIEDTLHLNYVLQHQDKILTLFNSMNLLIQLEPKLKILWSPPIELKCLEAPLTQSGLQCPHDLVIETDNTILINSSARQELYRFYLKEKKLELIFKYIDEELAWNRGLALYNNHVFIGTGNGTIIEIDLATNQEVKRLRVFNDDNYKCAIFGILISKD